MAVASLIHDTFQRGGAKTNMELELYQAFQNAGLPPPKMRSEMLIGGEPETRRWLHDILLTLWPKAVEYGLPSEKIGDLETLAERLEEELRVANSFATCICLVSAFARQPAS
jgi:hypothetical protein